MVLTLDIISCGTTLVGMLRFSEHCRSLDHLSVTHSIVLVRHEAAVMQLVMMMFGHCGLNVICWKAAATTVSIRTDRVSLLLLIE